MEEAQPEHRRRARRELLARAALLTVSTLVSLAGAEVLLRVLEARQAGKAPDRAIDIFRENPRGTGSYRLKPNLRLRFDVEGVAVDFATNRLGMPWREVDVAPTAGRPRIAVLGDSFAMGCWAPGWAQTFAGVAERELADVEVLNFGIGGFGLRDQELLLAEEVVAFAPDLVIVALFNGNDFRDTWLGKDKERIEAGTAVLDPEVLRNRVPEAARRPDGIRSVDCERRGLEALASRLALFRSAERVLDRDGLCVDFRPSAEFTQFSYWSRARPDAVALEARDAAASALDSIRAAAQAAGARLGIVAIPTFEQVHARRWQGRAFDIALPQAWVGAWSRERGVPFLDLLPPMREHLARTGERLYLRRDVHLNPRGHAFAGEAIAQWVRCCARAR